MKKALPLTAVGCILLFSEDIITGGENEGKNDGKAKDQQNPTTPSKSSE